MIDPPLQRGDVVRVRADARELNAFVALASPDGHSLILMFDGMIGGHVGAMAVLYDPAADAWAALLDHLPVTIMRRG